MNNENNGLIFDNDNNQPSVNNQNYNQGNTNYSNGQNTNYQNYNTNSVDVDYNELYNVNTNNHYTTNNQAENKVEVKESENIINPEEEVIATPLENDKIENNNDNSTINKGNLIFIVILFLILISVIIFVFPYLFQKMF